MTERIKSFLCGICSVLIAEIIVWLFMTLPSRGEDLAHTVVYMLGTGGLMIFCMFLIFAGMAGKDTATCADGEALDK